MCSNCLFVYPIKLREASYRPGCQLISLVTLVSAEVMPVFPPTFSGLDLLGR